MGERYIMSSQRGSAGSKRCQRSEAVEGSNPDDCMGYYNDGNQDAFLRSTGIERRGFDLILENTKLTGDARSVKAVETARRNGIYLSLSFGVRVR